MKVFSNQSIRHSFIPLIIGITSATVILIAHAYQLPQHILLAFAASWGIALWSIINNTATDYIVTSEAPIATIVMSVILVIFNSPSLACIACCITLLIFHYWFSSYSVSNDTYITAVLFACICFFSTYHIWYNIQSKHILHIYTGICSDPYYVAFCAFLFSTAVMLSSKIFFELSLLSTSPVFGRLIGVHPPVAHICISLCKALTATLIISIIGWMGALIPLFFHYFKDNIRISLLLSFIYIVAAYTLLTYINPYIYLLTVVSATFFYSILSHKRRL